MKDLTSEVILACHAMATRFEVVLYGEDQAHLYAAGEEALEEICRLEQLLSLYIPSSEISGINAYASQRPIEVSPRVMRLLVAARELSSETEGAFDITVAPLMQCWSFMGGTGKLPDEEAVQLARERIGMEHLILDESAGTVQFDRPGVMLDLGSIGKGYAVDAAVSLLREQGITSALLHGGSSSIYAIGTPPFASEWAVGVHSNDPNVTPTPIHLRDQALSVSAPHGKCFEVDGKRYGHVIDPRSGYPVGNSLLAAVVTSSAMEGDALSTALLVLGSQWLPRLRAGIQAYIVEEGRGANPEAPPPFEGGG